MKRQTDWVKCPICEGNCTIKTLTFGDGSYVTGKDLDRVLSYEFKLPYEITHEACQACKDSEFKGCLPIYEEFDWVQEQKDKERLFCPSCSREVFDVCDVCINAPIGVARKP